MLPLLLSPVLLPTPGPLLPFLLLEGLFPTTLSFLLNLVSGYVDFKRQLSKFVLSKMKTLRMLIFLFYQKVIFQCTL